MMFFIFIQIHISSPFSTNKDENDDDDDDDDEKEEVEREREHIPSPFNSRFHFCGVHKYILARCFFHQVFLFYESTEENT